MNVSPSGACVRKPALKLTLGRVAGTIIQVNPRIRTPDHPRCSARGVLVACLCTTLGIVSPGLATEAEEPPEESPQTAPQSQPSARPGSSPSTWTPQTKFTNRREMMRQWLIDQGKDPDEIMRPKIRYEKGSFMVTGSMEIDKKLYDGTPHVARWIEELKPMWLERVPLAAKMGNPGRVTYRIVTTRKDGVYRMEMIEKSGLDSYDESVKETIEEARPIFQVPDDYPADWAAIYLKFHFNMYSEM